MRGREDRDFIVTLRAHGLQVTYQRGLRFIRCFTTPKTIPVQKWFTSKCENAFR